MSPTPLTPRYTLLQDASGTWYVEAHGTDDAVEPMATFLTAVEHMVSLEALPMEARLAHMSAMEAQLADVEAPTDVIDVSKLTPLNLIRRREQLLTTLQEMGEIPHALTPEGRELHSELAAIVVEMHKRHKKHRL